MIFWEVGGGLAEDPIRYSSCLRNKAGPLILQTTNFRLEVVT